MRQAIAPLHEAVQQLLPLADQDSQAFNDYLVREGGEGRQGREGREKENRKRIRTIQCQYGHSLLPAYRMH